MPEVSGVLETALYVEDLDRATDFYQNLFGFELLLQDERLHALSVAGNNVLLLFKKRASVTPNPVPGGTVPPHDGEGENHIAFAIPESATAAWEEKLQQSNISIESRVYPDQGGVSIYFRDPDRHLIELVTPGIWPIY